MQNDGCLLTIGIPTWNRANELRQCLQLLIPQVAASEGKAEILISDNASDDETQSQVQAYKLPFLRYSRNSHNIGPDRNFLEVLRRASGKYVWLMSDDDFITDNAICEMLRIISLYSPSHISTNSVACDEEGNILPHRFQPNARYMVHQDKAKATIDEVFTRRNHWLSFISINIFRKNLLDLAEYEQNLDKFQNWIQVYMVAHVLSQEPLGYLSSYCAVKWRVGNCPAPRRVFTFVMPEVFASICEKFSLNESVRKQLYCGIRRTMLPIHHYIVSEKIREEASPYIVPEYYRVAAGLRIIRGLVLGAWKTKRLMCGKGFSLPQDILE